MQVLGKKDIYLNNLINHIQIKPLSLGLKYNESVKITLKKKKKTIFLLKCQQSANQVMINKIKKVIETKGKFKYRERFSFKDSA